ncbi:prepilin peptidase [Candidatus Nomurabacteria bacterium]|nr:prepilin peptidase [Candidatus Nomurabacteria bacterium]
MIFLPLIIFIFGLIIGSFLNVVILRINTGRSIAKGRSKCARCSTTLSWYELIPVFSFLTLRGKCKTCKNPISFQYPLVELTTALVFTILYTKILLSNGFNFFGIVSFLGASTISALLIVIFAYDIKHKIIPDKIVYPFIIISLASVFWRNVFGDNDMLIKDLFAGPALAAPFFFLWFFSKGRAMGFGDVKLSLGIGWLLGLAGSLATFFLSFWLGAIVGLLLMASSKTSLKSEIAFAPFLIIAVFIVGVFSVTLQSLFPIW